MNGKKTLIVFLLLTGVLLLSQCTGFAREDDDMMVMNRFMQTDIKGLDPVLASDLYSATIVGAIYQPLYEYHYLKRPYKVVPLLAEEKPEISEDRKTYTIRIQKGIHFHDDPCFPEGKGRELIAEDFIYSFKRIADVSNKSTGWWIFNDRIVGLNEFREYTSQADTVDYSREVEGLRALDKYTIQINLTKPFPQLLYLLTMPYTVAVPREAVNYYGREINRKPVGTGPFLLKDWSHGNRIILERNPNYWDDRYPTEGMPEDFEAGLLEDAGKKLPFIDRVNIYIYREPQTWWLNFLQGNLDIAGIPPHVFATVIDENRQLIPEFKNKGITLYKEPSLDLTYIGFNMEDPDIGRENAHLRKAIGYAYNVDHVIEHLYNHRAVPAVGPIPPGIFGYREDLDNQWAVYNPEKALLELEKAGFPGGEGAPVLTLESSGADSLSRQMSDYFVQALDEVGLRVRVNSNTFPEMLNKLNTKQAQVYGLAWGADYPDPENFLQLFYGPNESPGSNHFNYKNEEYDELYRKMLALDDGPQRQEIINRMVEILIEEAPCIFMTHRLSYILRYPWVRNFKPNEMALNTYKYFKIDKSAKD